MDIVTTGLKVIINLGKATYRYSMEKATEEVREKLSQCLVLVAFFFASFFFEDIALLDMDLASIFNKYFTAKTIFFVLLGACVMYFYFYKLVGLLFVVFWWSVTVLNKFVIAILLVNGEYDETLVLLAFSIVLVQFLNMFNLYIPKHVARLYAFSSYMYIYLSGADFLFGNVVRIGIIIALETLIDSLLESPVTFLVGFQYLVLNTSDLRSIKDIIKNALGISCFIHKDLKVNYLVTFLIIGLRNFGTVGMGLYIIKHISTIELKILSCIVLLVIIAICIKSDILPVTQITERNVVTYLACIFLIERVKLDNPFKKRSNRTTAFGSRELILMEEDVQSIEAHWYVLSDDPTETEELLTQELQLTNFEVLSTKYEIPPNVNELILFTSVGNLNMLELSEQQKSCIKYVAVQCKRINDRQKVLEWCLQNDFSTPVFILPYEVVELNRELLKMDNQ